MSNNHQMCWSGKTALEGRSKMEESLRILSQSRRMDKLSRVPIKLVSLSSIMDQTLQWG